MNTDRELTKDDLRVLMKQLAYGCSIKAITRCIEIVEEHCGVWDTPAKTAVERMKKLMKDFEA